ncbi:hypothetical protein EUTSA_v10020706mg [Eutrema salsugineum]|uniref:DNA N(6)-methyladenine demethylase n=1 Tax=Eutrema salsugineum TaxID=72664 RepID=V4M891_EUTSA|nr:uncharacterized protein LOC18023442 [Eutrema salsugineum]ESQ48573.1 hypothetical protein EUTSA_v10020706mg [Eutrema salsugineum]
MNHGEAWGSGGRRGSHGRSPASKHRAHRPESESPMFPLDEYSGSRGRGSRGRGRWTQSRSPRNSPSQVYVKKSSQVSNVGLVEKAAQLEIKSPGDGIGSTTQPDEVAALKFSGDNMDLLQSSDSSCSKNINFSGGEEKVGARMPCDLVNRMRDVSFSGHESVSSTGDQKAEVSGVKDHDSAHKSCDVGNSLNESNTRPFDLFLQTKVVTLKPSLHAVNRVKRNATKGYTGSVIRPGMVLLKNYLSINDQVMIVNKCRQLGLGKGGFYQPGYRDGALLHLKMMCFGKNWDPETSQYGETRPVDGSVPPKIPVEFNQFVEKAIEESQSLVSSNSKKTKGEDGIPFMSPDICIANFYTSTGRLGLHQDKDESEESIRKGLPVVSFSIGDSAEFLYGDQRDTDKADMVVLESGDVLLFGGKSRNVFHGVRSILKDTAPKVLLDQTSLRPGRLNLTFRQY